MKDALMMSDEVSQFYIDHRRDLTFYAFVLARSMPDAEDAVAEAVRKSWEHYLSHGTLCPPGRDPVAWMKTVIHNHLMTVFRGRRSAMRRLPRLWHGPDRDSAEDVLDGVLAGEAWKKLKDLSPRDQEIAHLLWREEWEPKKIADHLGIRPSTVRVAKGRILRRLRDALGLNEDGDTLDAGPGIDDFGGGEGVMP
jgi:RNA polymerase sigma factor (sigma-70 family)